MRSQRKYDPDFKREALRVVKGMRIREVERSLGIMVA